ncbi:MAG TPA: phospholipase D-like domain-containing protein [Chryseolinea sp.]|nr:phospholipase D-like domain-containing protein [Chryseolinea sp.]HPH45677.1 phospholipase D-like domain-containing protein [Chryseolinea sp.]HPM28911.1 phospholipase D-like domain-containing protein [Chryseolinea sp.]
MIVKKLAVPLINEKLLQQAEYCYIATAAISEAGFDFIRSRIPPKCKMEIVTGLDVLTSPQVLQRIWRNYQDRITLNIFTRNFFHANVYIFDLPYRKTVAFIGSGNFSLEGIKDSEEIFYKVTDVKEIEALKSWFTGYYEFSEPLTESIIDEYKLIFPSLKQNEIASRKLKSQFIELTTAGFNWDAIKFKNQFFKKGDYLTFANSKAILNTPEIKVEREAVQTKLLQLHNLIKDSVHKLKLKKDGDENSIVSSLDTSDHVDHRITSMWIRYGRNNTELNQYHPQARLSNFINLQIIIRQKEVGLWLMVGKQRGSKEDREYFKNQMIDEEYRNTFLKLLTGLGIGYWIEIAGDKINVETFQTADSLWEFTKSDDWMYYDFIIGRNYLPGELDLSTDTITLTIAKAFDKLVLVYRHIKDSSFDKVK